MPKVLLIISQNNFNDTEFSITKKELERREIELIVSSITTEQAVGMDGLRVMPDKTVRQANPNEYDGLIIIGGSGSPKLLEYPEVLERVRQFNEKGKLVAAICLAPTILARTGILKGVMSTVFPTDWAVTSLKQGGAHYISEDVVEDDNIITADGPKSAKQFADKIIEKLGF